MHSQLVQFLRSRGKDMTITICHNKLPEKKWGGSVDEVMPRRDGPENLRILKWRQLGIRPLKDVVEFSTVGIVVKFFGSRPADINWCAAHWGGVSIVWLAKNWVSVLVSPWTEGRNLLTVRIWNERFRLCFGYVYVLYTTPFWITSKQLLPRRLGL